jgi:hypothetical protein
MLINRSRALTPFTDRPDDERLTATHITAGKDLLN